MTLIILISIFFFLATPIHAQEFSLYQYNPVLKKDNGSAGVFQPFILKNGNLFSAWFSDSIGGKATIATMKSANGIDWYDKKKLQLSNRNSVHDPFMFMSNTEYQLYFASSNNGPISLWKSVSNDGVTFIPGQEKEILKPEQVWERFSVSSPTVIQDQSTHYLFYAGAGQSVWAVGMAISSNGEVWQKCSNNPVVPEGSGPHIVKYNNVFYLFYQSSIGLQVQQTNALNGCSTVWTNRHSISPPFGDPAPVVVESDLWLYGTFGTLEGQAIGLAGNVQIAQPTYPIVIIPGMFASWNKEAILHNTDVAFDLWKLNPAISEYEPLKHILGNRAYVFPYDWRKPIEETTRNLDYFLMDTFWNANPYQPIQIVGHSLGGVVGRVYADKNPIKPIKQVVTAGSPHHGLVQAYKPLAEGEIDRENTLLWMAQKLILLLNKPLFQSDKEAITQKLPVLFDILPVFPFLKDAGGSFIVSSFLNSLVAQYPIQSSPKIPQYYIGGSGSQTLAGYASNSSWTENGDGLVLLKNSFNQITPAPIQNHGEIIYAKESVKNILSKLNIQVQDSEIPPGRATSIFPAILVFIQSPATVELEHKGTIADENEGMIWIQQAEEGEYTLKVRGTGEGEYTASVWLIGKTDDTWIQFKKQTTDGKVDRFIILFDGSAGGTAEEYIAPTATPTPSPTLTPSPTPTDIPQSSSSNNNSSQNANSEEKKENEDSPKTNTNFIEGISDVIKKVTRMFENKKAPVSKKETVPHVLGVEDSKKISYHSPLTGIFFIKQILWGACAMTLLLFYEMKKMVLKIIL